MTTWHPTGFTLGWLSIGTVGAGAAILGAKAAGVALPPCLLRTSTGVPCPACGLTRVGTSPFTGRLGTALTSDPAAVLMFVVIGLLALDFAVRMVRGHGDERSRWIPAGVLIVLMGAHWATTLVTGGMT